MSGRGGIKRVTPHRELRGLLAAIAAGDLSACERLYELSSPKLYGLVLRLVRQPGLASEVLRRAYGQIFVEAARLSREKAPLGAMTAMARAASLDAVRARGGPDAWEPFQVGRAAADPLALSGRSPALMRVLAALGLLSEERRRMVLLAYYDGWTRDALGVYFDIPDTGVRAWLARSAQEIAAHLRRPT